MLGALVLLRRAPSTIALVDEVIAMKTYPIFNDKGVRAPIFEIDNIYISPGSVARLLVSAPGVTDVKRRKLFTKFRDIHVEFKYLGRSYIVLEPFGDNSRYWIGPADMVKGMEDVPALDQPDDILKLEEVFKRYQSVVGDLLTFRFITRFFH